MPVSEGVMAARPARTRSVRLTLFGLLVVPVVSLLALWGVGVGSTLGSAVTEHDYNSVTRTIGVPTQALADQLAQEQAQTFVWVSTGGRSPAAPLDAARRRTDAVVATASRALESVRAEVPAPAARPLATLLARLSRLGGLRAGIDSGAVRPPAAFQAYSDIIDAEFLFFLHAIHVQDASLFQQSVGTVDASRALVLAGREAALVGGALAARGQMSAADRELFASTVTSQRLLMADAQVLLDPGIRADYQRAYSSPAYHRFAAVENQIAASAGARGPIPVSPRAWEAVSASFLGAMRHAVAQNTIFLASLANRLSTRLVTDAVLAGGLGLAAVIASVFLMLWFGRRLSGELTGLHTSVQSMAADRLPSIVARLRSGQDVDVAAESPPPATGKIAEISKVAQAFAQVQRTAVEAAVGQANLRKNVNRVFLNLSLRSQSLLHRQLSMLDAMERATSDPAALADLFRLDHLTTRMRRHAEGLIILSGATPGRGWREPVPAIDVLRAAVAEIEDYVRVEVICDSRDRLVGAAVTDVIHLIAELVENATAFSPPSTPVEVRAESVANGFAVEIEDRGLGLSADDMTAINERLARPPEFDMANSDQLGLFVVGQLAARHGIRVSLRDSPFGGARAIVLLPRAIMVREQEPGPQAGPDGDGQPAATAWAAGWPPAQGTAVVNRRRAALLTQTGRQRLAPPPDDEAASGLAFAAAGPAAPSPEEARTLLAGLQQNWQPGQTDDLDNPPGTGGDRRAEPPGADLPVPSLPSSGPPSSGAGTGTPDGEAGQ